MIDRLRHRLFGRHVLQRAHDRAGDRGSPTRDRSRDPEVHDDGLIVFVDHDVCGLEVAVDDTRLVRRAHAANHLPRDRDGTRDGQLTLFLQDRREIAALDVGHRQVLDAVDLAEIVDADDVLVRDLTGEQQLAFEPLLEIPRHRRIRGDLRTDHFQRDRDSQRVVPRLIHGAHAADTEQTNQVIARPEGRTGRERA